MPLISVSVDAFLILAVCILVSTLVLFRRQPPADRFSLHNALSAVAVLHSLWILYTILVRWPPNIFQRLKLPLTTPSETIRAILLQRAGLPQDAALPRPLDSLLTRLSSFDMRTLYVRSPCARSPVVRSLTESSFALGSARRSSRTASTARRSMSTPFTAALAWRWDTSGSALWRV